MKRKPDFSGYATRNDLLCSDGVTIKANAFADQDGQRVPLVWQHQYDEPANVLGHAILENRTDGVYAHAYLNQGESAAQARELILHEDVNALSIFANKLVKRGSSVIHGAIRELSLVLSGANPGAFIDTISMAHSASEGGDAVDGEAIIYTGLSLEHSEKSDKEKPMAKGKSIKDIFDTFTDEQKQVAYFMVGQAVKDGSIKQSDLDEDDDLEDDEDDEDPEDDDLEDDEDDEDEDDEDDSFDHSSTKGPAIKHSKDTKMKKRNVFDQDDKASKGGETLTHDQLSTIVEDAKKPGQTLKSSFLQHAVEYGIENIDFLFPDAKNIRDTPDFVKRNTEWVASVIDGTHHSPFSRIKSMSADITLDTARAKGYVKGSLKKEEFFKLSRRTTTPTTIYKKQKLDRNDMIDITDLNVVAWLKMEMRVMLDEEIARAILLGDGREVGVDDDKIDEDNIRPIATDDDFYAHKVEIAANVAGDSIVKAILRARHNYKGTGMPTMYCTESLLTDLILTEDRMGRRLYATQVELAAALRVKNIVPVEVMEGETELLAIIVNLKDYTVGADKGGSIAMFDDFDIDYNQYKYLMEGRMSGCLTLPKSALVISRAAGTEVTPGTPTFVASTGVITIPATTGVIYSVDGDVVSSGDQPAIASEATAYVTAAADENYFITANSTVDWTFTADVR